MSVMSGWLIPPPSEPVKSGEDLRREREAKIAELERRGLLRSERLRTAMLTVRREAFVPRRYRDHAYEEVPLPAPGRAGDDLLPAQLSAVLRAARARRAGPVPRGWRGIGLWHGSGAGGGRPRGPGRGDRYRRHHTRVRAGAPERRGLHRRGAGSRRR